jgi:hypothetical protein
MSFLKQVATRYTGATAGSKPLHGVASTRLIPNTEPTGAAYVKEKAKNYDAHVRVYKNTTTPFRKMYGFGDMWRYHKILKRDAKTNATRMAV